MAASPDTLPPLTLLAKHGMADYDARAIEFDKPVGARGLQADMTPTLWKVSITSLSASRPTIVAVRPELAEAEADARSRFLLIYRDRRTDVSHVVVPAPSPKKVKTTQKPVVEEDEDDGSDLI